MFLSKDFIETAEGLRFAVVVNGIEQDKVLCFLRYMHTSEGWLKVDTEQANELLTQQHSHYLHYSSVLDTYLHAVEIPQILKHHQPRQRLQQLLNQTNLDAIETDLLHLCQLLQQGGVDLTQLGVTGSLLLGVQKSGSDIDIVCYNRAVFHQCRELMSQLLEQGALQDLYEADWRDSYQRRAGELSYADYVWHERRKLNKALVNYRKFDLSLLEPTLDTESIRYQKRGSVIVQTKVADDYYAFDYPAVFKLDHDEFTEVVSFTATYTGQAQTGEWIEVSGQVEQTPEGLKRLVVGSTREAQGEYIKVING